MFDSILYVPSTIFQLNRDGIVSVEVSTIARSFSKTNEFSDIDFIGYRARNITIKQWEIDHFKIKVVTFIINFGINNIIRN